MEGDGERKGRGKVRGRQQWGEGETQPRVSRSLGRAQCNPGAHSGDKNVQRSEGVELHTTETSSPSTFINRRVTTDAFPLIKLSGTRGSPGECRSPSQEAPCGSDGHHYPAKQRGRLWIDRQQGGLSLGKATITLRPTLTDVVVVGWGGLPTQI